MPLKGGHTNILLYYTPTDLPNIANMYFGHTHTAHTHTHNTHTTHTTHTKHMHATDTQHTQTTHTRNGQSHMLLLLPTPQQSLGEH